ncbi:hypothetical protein L7F22_048434 [Adiantum nelumboides]|nr:hypothetical protein [Adiantum nelumboides]
MACERFSFCLEHKMALRGRPSKSKKQRTIEQTLGLHGPLAALTNVQTNDSIASEVVRQETNTTEKKKYQRVFKAEWKIAHSWAFCIVDKDNKERVGCKYYKYGNKKCPQAAEGATTLQQSALDEHADSDYHKEAKAMWEENQRRSTLPMEKHIATMTDDEKERFVTVMQVMWHVVKRNSPIEEFVHQCNFHRFLRTLNMPVTSEYSAYTSKDAGKQFAQAIKDVHWDRLKKDIAASPFYSIQIDESTDIST